MSWLLFMDESGHDHRQMPYEVRGGLALHAKQLWSFVKKMQKLERKSYGTLLSEFRSEIKGSSLLDKDRFRFASQMNHIDDELRRKYCRSFLTKGLEKKAPTRIELTAYGQASLNMARGIFALLKSHGAILFASAIPRRAIKPANWEAEGLLRKDHVYLLERFYYHLEDKEEHGLIVMDEVEKTHDKRFVRRLESYFKRTYTGRQRTKWIVPTPFFVSSDMAYPVQVADLCIYCINWGFRIPEKGMDAATRTEIEKEFGPLLRDLQFKGEGRRENSTFTTHGIVYVPNPYAGKSIKEKEAMLSGPLESRP